MLDKLLVGAYNDCRIEIAFNPTLEGAQSNPCRNDFIAVLRNTNLENARKLAVRLQSITDRRSGLGLLFVIVARDGQDYALLVSRFPADYGVLAEEDHNKLKVEFVEQVFMRSTYTYKAAFYKGTSLASDFWSGGAVDKQVTNKQVQLSGYWIRDFLLSDYKTTAAAGTRRLASSMLNVIDSRQDATVKSEIMAAAQLAGGLEGTRISIAKFVERFGLSRKATQALTSQLPNPSLVNDEFIFTQDEFAKHINYQILELDNGAVLSAQVNKFRECFSRSEVANSPGEYAFQTQGRIVEQKFRKRK